jgi:CRISPR-associated endoribonuclease Cas6
MRAMVEMTARRDYTFDHTYHRPLQGRLYTDLERSQFEGLHDDDRLKLFSFSPPIPPQDTEEGDMRRLIIAGHNPDLVTTAITGLCSTPELNLYEMPYTVERAFSIETPLGDRGEITTGAPIVIRFAQPTAEEYEIDTNYDKTYWRPPHGTSLFFDRLYDNLQQKYRLAFDEPPPDPPYFTEYSLERTVSKPLQYEAESVVYIGSEWTFKYEIESAAHRKLLQLALDTGLGELNGLGFGFVNRGIDVNDGSDKDMVSETGDG